MCYVDYMRLFWLTGIVTMGGGSGALAQDEAVTQTYVPVFEVGTGAFGIDLPGVQNTLLLEDSFDTNSKIQNLDGGYVSGVRFDVSAAIPIMETATGAVYLGVSGFYAQADQSQNSFCDGIDNEFRCGWMNPFSTTNKRGFGSGHDVTAETDRNVDYYGTAVELTLHRGSTFSFGAGVDIRRLNQDLVVFAYEDQTPDNTYDYTEWLNTTYFGAFVGVAGTVDLGGGFYLGGRGRIGPYNARTQYNGTYFQTGSSIATEVGSGTLSERRTTYIGSLRGEIGLKRNNWALLAFAEMEYIGWVPGMEYMDESNSAAGFVDETAITDNESTTYAVGVRFQINF